MKLMKNLLLGSAASLMAVSGVQAADLPLAEPVEYVKVCDTFGRGYFYIPGTQTCLQLSGYVRADLRTQAQQTRADDEVFFRTRARLNFDARTQTEYGTLRAYIRLQSDFTNTNQSSKPTGSIAGQGSETYAEKAFVQFAGFTVGLSQSFFDMLNYTTFSSVFSDQTVQLAAYTATFGSGMSFTLSAEDRSYREAAIVGGAYAGTEMPDIVAAFRVDQGWGSFQLSGAAHQLRGTAGAVEETEYGFAVQAGLNIKLPALGANDTFWVQGVYADGALNYLGDSTAPWRTSGLVGFGRNDGAFVGTGIDTSTGYTVGAGLQHFWTPTLRSSVTAIYTDVENAGLVGDYAQVFAAGNLVWSPVQSLDVGLEVFYANLTDTPAAFTGNDDRWGGILRVQRNF